MDVNYSETDWIPDNGHGHVHGHRHGHSWRQDTYSFTPHEYHMHLSPAHSRSEAIQPQSLAATTLPPLNTVISTEPPSSLLSPFLRCPNISYLQPHSSHHRERQHGADIFSHDHHLAGSTLQLPSPQMSASPGHTSASRPNSRLSWNSEEVSVSTLPPWPSQFQESFIDLTADSSSPLVIPPESRKRPASTSRGSDHASASFSKRTKLEDRQTGGDLRNIAELDLREIEDDESCAKVIEEQRKESVKAQHEQAEKPVKFSNLQCIICMEPMTNITVTHCGMPINQLKLELLDLTLTSFRAPLLPFVLDGGPYSGGATKPRSWKRVLQMPGLPKEGSEAQRQQTKFAGHTA